MEENKKPELKPNKKLVPVYGKGEKQKDIDRLRDLLLAEADPNEMEFVAASVLNRFQSPEGGFDNKKPKNYSDVINANGYGEQYPDCNL